MKSIKTLFFVFIFVNIIDKLMLAQIEEHLNNILDIEKGVPI